MKRFIAILAAGALLVSVAIASSPGRASQHENAVAY